MCEAITIGSIILIAKDFWSMLKKAVRKMALSIPTLSKAKQQDLLSQIDSLTNQLQILDNELKQRKNDGHYAYFYYKTKPKTRYGWGKDPNKFLNNKIEQYKDNYALVLKEFAEMRDFFSTIKLEESENEDQALPYWKNILLPVIDAISICGFIKKYQPNKFIEIGSGNSTRFASYAARHFSPHTKVISIDPYPGNTIQAFPDIFIKEALEDTDLTVFDDISDHDIIWLDGSHRSFSNTDVTVFFMDVIPRLSANPLIGIHDIPFPWDYFPGWNEYYLNEAFVLAAYLVGAEDAVEYVLPCFYINNIELNLRKLLDPVWSIPQLKMPLSELDGGGAFWFRKLY
jgi:hypothetical protein